MKHTEGQSTPPGWTAILAVFLLCVGVGRLFSFVVHEPLLAYANSYDMIRLQACHQIWPNDEGIDITVGTPEAPLRFYTLDKTVDTPCFPGSELVFTSMGIELAKLRNGLTGETRVSIKMIAGVKAAALAATVVGFSLFFLQRRNRYALLLNALCMLVVLSDPAITLYLGTFYTEFSAVYFLYVLLAGTVVLAMGQYHWRFAWPLLIGIAGLGLSKPQHMPLALLAGTLLSGYLAMRPRRFGLAAGVFAVAVMPLMLLLAGHFTPRDEKMAVANKLNLVSSLLTVSDSPQQTLQALQLPAACQNIAGKEWTVFAMGQEILCPAFQQLTYGQLASAGVSRYQDYVALVYTALPVTKEWIVKVYGHVEGAKRQFVNGEHITLTQWFPDISGEVFTALFFATGLMALVVVGVSAACAENGIVVRVLPRERCLFALLLAVLMWAVFLVAVVGDGLFDIGKHTHLLVPLLLMTLLALVCMPMQLSRSDT